MKKYPVRKPPYRRKWKPSEPYQPMAFAVIVLFLALIAALSCIDGC